MQTTGRTRYTRVPLFFIVIIISLVTFSTGSLTTAHAETIDEQPDPLILIPGLVGSELNAWDNATQTVGSPLWPHLNFAKSVGMYEDQVRATDILRDLFVLIDVYQPLIDMLTDPQQGGYTEYQIAGDPTRLTSAGCDTTQTSATLFIFPYDWRLSNARNAQLLDDYVSCVQTLHPNSKVDIMAHSMGGLVARRYVLDNTTTDAQGNPAHAVDQFISVGVPWLGAGSALPALEKGSLFSWLPAQYFDLIGSRFKQLIEFSSGTHELLPSEYYFQLNDAATFKEDGWDFDGDGTKRETYTYNHLMDVLDEHHPIGSVSTINGKAPGTNNREFHRNGQDDWRTDTTGISYYQIYGYSSVNNTVTNIAAKKSVVCILFFCTSFDVLEATMGPGDGLVPLHSATRRTSAINLNPQSELRGFYGPFNVSSHIVLVQNPDVHAYMLDVLQGERAPQPQSDPLLQSPPQVDEAYYVQVIGTPSVTVTDANGNSVDTVSGADRNALPSVTAQYLGESAHMVVLPSSDVYTATFVSTDTPFSVEIRQGTSDTTTQAVRYKDMVLPAGKAMQVIFTPEGIGALSYDSNGDGVVDTTVDPTVAISGAEAGDVVPPEVTVETIVQGDKVLVTLTADDSVSGVKGIYYSLDGANYQTYTVPFEIDPAQVATVYVFADDNLENRSSLMEQDVALTDAKSVVFVPFVQR